MTVYHRTYPMCLQLILTLAVIAIGRSAAIAEYTGPLSALMTTANRMADPTPKAWSMSAASEAVMDYSSGTAALGIDLMSLKVGSFTLDLGLNYQLRAYKAREESGWIGLGWSLNGTGAVTRTIAGLPDELGYDSRSVAQITADATVAETYFKKLERRELDALLDRYSYSCPGGSGLFVVVDDRVVQLPQTDNIVEIFNKTAKDSWDFRVITPNGTCYEFTARETCTYNFQALNLADETTKVNYTAVTVWHLSRIILPESTDVITYGYATMPSWTRSLSEFTQSVTIVQNSLTQLPKAAAGVAGGGMQNTNELKFNNPKILKTISARTGTVTFEHDSLSYQRPGPHMYISGMQLTNAAGEQVLSVGLQAEGTSRRRLKSVSLRSNGRTFERRTFSYYSSNAQDTEDFFGYPNGKSTIGSLSHGVVDMTTGRFNDRRMPDTVHIKCDALIGWKTNAGLKTRIRYETSMLPDSRRLQFIGQPTVTPRSTATYRDDLSDDDNGSSAGRGESGNSDNSFAYVDTVVGLRIRAIETEDTRSGVTSTRTFKYSKPRCSIDLCKVDAAEFAGMSGTWKYDLLEGFFKSPYCEITTTIGMLNSSKTPGVSPEHASIFYGEVEEYHSGTGLDKPIKRQYIFDTSDCRADMLWDGYTPQDLKEGGFEIADIFSVADLRPLSHGDAPECFTAAFMTGRSSLSLNGYRQEKIGSAPRLTTVTDYEYRGGTYQKLESVEYSYEKTDHVSAITGTHYCPRVRQALRQTFRPEYEYKSYRDFSFIQTRLQAWRTLLRGERTTRYFADGSKRIVNKTYRYTGDSVTVFGNVLPPRPRIVTGNTGVLRNTSKQLFNPFNCDTLKAKVDVRLPMGYEAACGSDRIARYTAYSAQSTARADRQACARGLRALPLAELTVRNGDSTLARASYSTYRIVEQNMTRPSSIRVWTSGATQPRKLISTVGFCSYSKHGLPTNFKATGAPTVTYHIDNLDQVRTNTIGSGDMSLSARYSYLQLIGCDTITRPDGLTRTYGYDGVRLSSIAGRNNLLLSSYDYLTDSLLTRSSEYMIPAGPSVNETVTDATGRNRWTMRRQYGADCTVDIVENENCHDALGRTVRKYLPYGVDSRGNETPYSYTSLIYPASAQTGPKSTVLPGIDMVGHASTTAQTCSSTADAARKVRRFTFKDGRLSMGQLYGDGELDCTTTTDADGRRMWMFTDWEGRNVLRRQESENNVYADTYFVYDTQGRLALVLPPIASTELSDGTLTCAQAVAQKAYTVRYDYRSRPVATKRPTCAEVRTAYDSENRAVFTRDGNQLANGRRLFNVFDSLNRVVITGTCIDSDAETIWTNGYNLPIVSCGHAGRRGTGFCNTGYVLPATLTEMLQDARILNVFYYDGYTHLEQPAAPDGANPSPKGRQTGSLTAVLGEGYTDKLVGSDIYYDLDGNVLRSTSALYRGGSTQIDIEYNPYGLPLKERHTVKTCASRQLLREPELKTFSYTLSYTHDRHGRTTATWLNYLDRDYKLSEVKFDSLGRVSDVTSQGGIVRSTRYDLRGMVKAWNTPAISQQLMYTDGTMPSYTGRVSSKVTDAGTQFHSRYDYSYDKLGRLVAANQQDIDDADVDFSTSYSYDLESNLTRLQRKGKTAPTQYGLINDITATYHCGQITGQVDEAETGTYEGNLTLRPIQNGSIQPTGPPTSRGRDNNACTYDADGRLTRDPSRGIVNIVYNEIGMPQKVLFNNGTYIGYVYLADGKKVEQTTCQNIAQFGFRTIISKTVYDEAFEISLGNLSRLNVPGGYVTPRDSVFHVYVPDYQGNNVAVINTATGQTEQLTDYYPYGQPINNGLGASVNPYKYGGKELLTANGYNASDFTARWLSHSLPAFQSPDPLCMKQPWYSMYVYCHGDPINYMDMTGLLEWPVPLTYKGQSCSHLNNYDEIRPKQGGGYRTHKGIDINIGSGAFDLGAPVLATHTGIISAIKYYTDDINGGGTRVYIKYVHNGNVIVETRYMHLNDVARDLKVGDIVHEGQQIGTIGGSGNGKQEAYLPHLHYEVRKLNQIIDPRLDGKHLKDPQKMIDNYIDGANELPIILPALDVIGERPESINPLGLPSNIFRNLDLDISDEEDKELLI